MGKDAQTPSFLNNKFKKICIAGSGKGRIELVGSKYTFSYESQFNLKKNIFELALDFPIIGETRVELSLNPKEVSKKIGHSELIGVLRQQIGDRADLEEVIKTVEEFFVFASDFIHYKAFSVYPVHFKSNFENDHFNLERSTPHYIFQIDNFSENENYFERTVFKIFVKSVSETIPRMTLFLVPQACDKL